MENASKALIIAGSILVSIMIIGLGVLVYQRASGVTSSADFTDTKAQAQDGKFEDYYGKNVTAAEVKTLLTTIRSNNITSGTSDEAKTVYVVYNNTIYGGGKADLTKLQSSIQTGRTYVVEPANGKALSNSDDATKDPSNANEAAYYATGYIRIIKITQNNTSSSSSSGT